MSPITGAEMVVIRRRTAAMRRKATPTQCMGDVFAMMRMRRT
jgi:hypothetical protein